MQNIAFKTVARSKYFLKIVRQEFAILQDLRKESPPNGFTGVHGDDRAPPVWMAQEMVTAPCSNNFKTKFPKGFDKLGTGD